MADMLKVTIDDQTVEVPRGTLLVEACRQLGIEVPVYCYHPKMNPVGACRVCVVEVVGGRPKPIQTACTTECTDQMVVKTRSADANRAREGILEFLLVNHPLDCPVCDRAGECDLQDFTLRYGPPNSRFVEEKRHFDKSVTVGCNVVLDRERCIMCQRCARFCAEVAMEEGLAIIERGSRSEIGTFEGRPYDSVFSGNTIELCPVGALTAKSYRFRSRPWEQQHFAGVCTQCSLGCNLTLDVRYDRLVRCRSRVNDAIDDGWLCDRGRYGFEWVHSEDRLTAPLVRENGRLTETTWEEALKRAQEGFRKAQSAGALAGHRLSNEAAWVLLRLVRGVWNSPHLDHRRARARVTRTARVEGLDSAEAILLVGCDPTRETPVLDLRIKKALRRGAQLLILGDEPCALAPFAEARAPLSALRELKPGEASEAAAALVYPAPRPWEPGGTTEVGPEAVARHLAGKTKVTLIASEANLDAFASELSELAARYAAPHGLLTLGLGANSAGLRELGVTCEAPGWLPEAWAFAGGVNRETGSLEGAKALLCALETPPEGSFDHVVALATCLTPELEQRAHVVLPACAFPEQIFTLVSTDGTLQLSRQALPPPGQARPDWRILADLAGLSYPDAASVFLEIGQWHPAYRGASYARFTASEGVHWSYPQQGQLGTPRPDLSAIPASRPDAPPWAPAPLTGSRVEDASRIRHGDAVPSVPGQEDPRRVAAALSLAQGGGRAAPPPPP
ncbi:MAG: NADH-quinone oxidoreductase subunit NuoG, partial [Candidatus Eremiobacterota bacterium]